MPSLVEMFVTQAVLLSLLWLHLAESSPLALPQRREVQLNNDLALNMLQTLGNGDNAFFSPLSLSTALLTLLNGAEGETDKELRKVLDLNQDDDLNALNSGIKSLLESLDEKNSKELNIKLLTRLLVAKKSEESSDSSSLLKEAFVKTVKESLKSDVKEVDFLKNSKQVTKELNEWVRGETNQRIQRLFRDNLDSSSSLVLANAVYFSGKWRRPFNRTAKRDFKNLSYQIPGLPTNIPFMSLEDSLRSKTRPELKSTLVELPYSHDLSMIVVVPDSMEDLQYLNENMTSSQLTQAVDDLMSVEPSPLRVTMPRFKLEADYDLKEPLEELIDSSLGLFSSANLGKAFKQSSAAMKVSQAVHRASIDVNEEGTEAAAATGVQLQYLSLPAELVVDRPFIFMIRDSKSGVIAFMGRVQSLVDEESLGLTYI